MVHDPVWHCRQGIPMPDGFNCPTPRLTQRALAPPTAYETAYPTQRPIAPPTQRPTAAPTPVPTTPL